MHDSLKYRNKIQKTVLYKTLCDQLLKILTEGYGMSFCTRVSLLVDEYNCFGQWISKVKPGSKSEQR